jgi:ATP-dependent protease Clp ATPase subunit
MMKLRQLRCSFCRKTEREVAKLVAGPRVYICDECVAIANHLMNDPHDENQPTKPSPTVWRKLLTRVRGLLHGSDARRISSLSVSG